MEFGFEIDAAAGAQVGGKLCGVDRIAVVVTGTVGDERDERTDIMIAQASARVVSLELFDQPT